MAQVQPKITAFFTSPKAQSLVRQKDEQDDKGAQNGEPLANAGRHEPVSQNEIQPMILIDDDNDDDDDDQELTIVADNSSVVKAAKTKDKQRKTSFFKRTPKRKRPPEQQEDNELPKIEDGIIGMKVRSPINGRQQQQATSATGT